MLGRFFEVFRSAAPCVMARNNTEAVFDVIGMTSVVIRARSLAYLDFRFKHFYVSFEIFNKVFKLYRRDEGASNNIVEFFRR
ncbi:hypothetical protein FIV06_24330 [Labrenzia sp. THAF191b]|nr:hypothetical protein FIV06_24330 [Labrenzia sp. THAF191b]QFT06891.1 hypothetical protein FIV05_24325 [Labrenzia sp. THAF191a]QFT18435.1 hypothetical protein FIV03_24340 [Labrenzia sp. THAF187b]